MHTLHQDYYKGGFDNFLKMRKQVFKKAVKDYEKQQKALRLMKTKGGKSAKQAEASAKKRERGGAKKGGAPPKTDAAGNVDIEKQELVGVLGCLRATQLLSTPTPCAHVYVYRAWSVAPPPHSLLAPRSTLSSSPSHRCPCCRRQ